MLIKDKENYFFALRIPKESWGALELVQEHLPKDGIRYTMTREFHLTLKFLGPLSELKAMEIRLKIKEWMSSNPLSASHFVLSFKKVGLFYHERVPRVVWVGLNFPHELYPFHRDLEFTLEPFGFPLEKRTFNPHITLARLKDIRHAELKGSLNDLVSNFQTLHVNPQSFSVDRLELIRSRLVDGRPPEYQTIEAFSF